MCCLLTKDDAVEQQKVVGMNNNIANHKNNNNELDVNGVSKNLVVFTADADSVALSPDSSRGAHSPISDDVNIHNESKISWMLDEEMEQKVSKPGYPF